MKLNLVWSVSNTTHPNTTLLTVMLLDQGGLFDDVESIVWVFNMRDGLYATTAEAWEEPSNSTALAGDDSAITLHAYMRSIGNTRLVFFTLFVVTAVWRSIFRPTECSILKNAARRSVIGGSQEGVEQAHGTADTVLHEGSQDLSTYEETQGDVERAPELQRTSEYCEDAALDAESEATVNGLSDDDELIVFMPSEEFAIADGPKRSVACFLLNGNHRMARRINDFGEEYKGWMQISAFLGFIITLVALTEVIPLNLTWLSLLCAPDTTRCFFKLNTQAVKLCVSETFDFQVPFVSLTLAMLGFMASFEFHPGCCASFAYFYFLYVTQILLGKWS